MILHISALEERRYRIIVESESNRMEFTGYHTDIEGIKLVSLELHHPSLGEGRAMRWLLLGYEFHEDGSFSPLFLSRYVQPTLSDRDDYLKYTGAQIYSTLSGAAKSEHYRTRLAESNTQCTGREGMVLFFLMHYNEEATFDIGADVCRS
jgi:hypothetical protein